jgi:hypothetical protein
MIRHHQRIARAAALTLALTAIAASPASANPPPTSPGTCSEVCSGGGYGPGPSRPAATPTSSQPRSKIANTGTCSEACSGNGYDLARVPPTVVRSTSGASGFDWGDAGIGAAGGLALSMIGVGGALAVSQRRSRRTTALPS